MPVSQDRQTDWPGKEKNPGGHGLHTEGDLAPMTAENEPESHGLHISERAKSENLPAGHGLHAREPANEKVPDGHGMQTFEEMAETAVENEPDGQVEQKRAPIIFE